MGNKIIPFIFIICLFSCYQSIAQVADLVKPICSSQSFQNNNATEESPFDIQGSCATLQGRRTLWYIIQIETGSQFTFQISTGSGVDYDFAVWLNPVDLDNLGPAIRLCFALPNTTTNTTGLQVNAPQECQDESGDGQVRHIDVLPGDQIVIGIDRFSNVDDTFDIDFGTGGVAALTFNCDFEEEFFVDDIQSCAGGTEILDATIENATAYEWSVDLNDGNGSQVISGETNPTLDINSVSGTYSIRASNTEGVTFLDSVDVLFATTPAANTVSDLYACPSVTPGFSDAFDTAMVESQLVGGQTGVETTYTDGLGNTINSLPSFLSNGVANEETIIARIANTSNPDCFSETNFKLIVYQAPIVPVFTIPTTASICSSGGSALIGEDFNNPNYSYLWSTGDTNPTTTVTAAGNYTLEVTNNENGIGCTYEQTVVVGESDVATITNVTSTYFAGNTVTVTAEGTGDYEYALDGGAYQDSNVFEGIRGGEYEVTVNDKNGCGVATSSILVVDYPKYFTPNGDGFHDSWNIINDPRVPLEEIYIYDRYGKFLKQISPTGNGWTGYYNGKPLPSSDYWFTVFYTRDGIQLEYKGHFTLKR
jgi:gliding motility-associated-like protein